MLSTIWLFVTVGVVNPSSPLLGEWLEPSGGVLSVAPCGDALCATLTAFTRTDGPTTDANNPDATLRARPLCGLTLGTFVPTDATHAEDGHIYDPKNGKTYSAAMSFDGEDLRLRGYVGLKIFGRTEVWKRYTGNAKPCARPAP